MSSSFSFSQVASDLIAYSGDGSNTSNSLTIICNVDSVGNPIISTNQRILGDLSATGSVKLDGIIEGNIYCASIVILANGRVNGGIVATREVIVHGKVTGAIRSRLVMLQSSAKVEGDISYQRISIEMGASHDGMLCRTKDEHVVDEPNAPLPDKQEERPEEVQESHNDKSASSGLNRRFSMHNVNRERFSKDDLRHESGVYLLAE